MRFSEFISYVDEGKKHFVPYGNDSPRSDIESLEQETVLREALCGCATGHEIVQTVVRSRCMYINARVDYRAHDLAGI